MTVVEGVEEVTRAVRSGTTIHEAYVVAGYGGRTEGVAALVDLLNDAGVEVVDVDDTAFERIAVRGVSAAVVAVVADPTIGLEELEVGDAPLLLVVEGVEKPGNLGGMLRTADAVGVDAVIVADPTTDVTNPNVVRASLGCLFTVPVAVAATEEVVDFLRRRAVTIVATMVGAEVDLWEADLTGPVAVVVGAEHAGLGPAWAVVADVPIRIPMAGSADSLNAGIAAAVVLYEAARQRSRA